MATMMSEPTAALAVSALAGKYLTFVLGAESYAISVLKVREIIRLAPITVVPQMPSYVKGVINLRGKIIPVVDLRLRLGVEQTDSDSTCIVVVQVRGPAQAVLAMGLIVDSVEEVLNITAGDLEPTPDFGCQVDTAYILAMAKIKGLFKALLDIDRVVGGDSQQIAQELAQG